MSFRATLAILGRRWYVMVAVLVITTGSGWLVSHPKPTYQAVSVMLLVPPRAADQPNRIAGVTPSIAATGVMVDQLVTERATVPGVSVTPRNNGTTETPAYTVPAEQLAVTAGNPATALSSLQSVMTLFENELAAVQNQAGVAPAQRITSQVLVPAGVGRMLGSRSRGLIGVGLLGVGAAVVVPIWFDRILKRRRFGRRRLTRRRAWA